jgi:flagellar M-ring protein FliF
VIGSSFGICLVLVLVLVNFLSQEEHVPLFDYIRDKREALAVQNRLTEFQIPFKVSDGGHVVLVPRSKKETTLLALAEANSMPNEVMSYAEILDANSSFGLTEKELDSRMNRAKEGSLAQMIKLFRNIEHADVRIEQAKDSLFEVDQKETRVSVLLIPSDPLSNIGRAQVSTILNLVKHSVLGVKKENIFISDDKGNDLTDLMNDQDRELSHRDLAIRIERDLRKKATDSLSEIYGKENSSVAITVFLDLDEVDENSKELAPPVEGEDQGVKISEETKESKTQTADPKAVPGTQTNIPGYQAPETVRTATETKEARINYAYKQRTRNIKKAVGNIERMTVSVVINRDVLPDGEMTPEIESRIINMVSTAVGLDKANRRDEISVTAFHFNRLRLEQKMLRDSDFREFEARIFSSFVMAVLLAILLGLYRTYRRQVRKRREEILRATQESLDEKFEKDEEVISEEQRERNERERFVLEAVRDDPDSVVKIIRTMMFDESYY